MTAHIPITEATLRRAMRDDRYWRPHHPERERYVNWVTEGWRALVASDARTADGAAVVHVRAYDRVRDGKVEHVDAHTRSAPMGRGSMHDAGGARVGAAETPRSGVVLAQAGPLLLFSRPPVGPTPRIPMRRIPNQSGKEAASDVPSWARGSQRYTDETPRDFARRVMDEQYGPGNWNTRQGRREFEKIKKYGSRAFQDPNGLLFGFPLEPRV